MFSQMRDQARTAHLDQGIYYTGEIPKDKRAVMIHQIAQHAKKIRQMHENYESKQQKDLEEELEEIVDDAKSESDQTKEKLEEKAVNDFNQDNQEDDYVTLDDGTTLKWTPKLEKILREIEEQRYKRELEIKYGLKDSKLYPSSQNVNNDPEENIYDVSLQESPRKQDGLLSDEKPINPEFNSSLLTATSSG